MYCSRCWSGVVDGAAVRRVTEAVSTVEGEDEGEINTITPSVSNMPSGGSADGGGEAALIEAIRE